MNEKQLERMRSGPGFVAALDQSGASTPRTLRAYGIGDSAWANEEEMFDLIHEMRTRVITNPYFDSRHLLAAILFIGTMRRKIEDRYTADYLWEKKGIVPFLKVDKGLDEDRDGCKLMKPIPDLDDILAEAKEYHIFGTKMRSDIASACAPAIRENVDQQFDIGLRIAEAGLVPILEPEVDIHIPDKAEAEDLVHAEIRKHLDKLPEDTKLMFKVSIPTKDDLYADIIADPRVVRVVSLSGGYSTEEANERLARNHGLIASYSRALLSKLRIDQMQEEFDAVLKEVIDQSYAASIT